MKVLIVNTLEYDLNGVANVIVSTVENMHGIASDVDITLTSYGEFNEANMKKVEGKVSIEKVPNRKKQMFKYLNHLKKIAKDYDVIHVHGNSSTMIVELFALRKYKNKVIVHGHATQCSHSKIHRVLKSIFSKMAKNRVACSEDAGKFLYNNDFTVLPNGIYTSRFVFNSEHRETLRNELGIDDKVVYLHVGFFNWQKNHNFLVDCIKKTDNSNKVFAFVGAGELEEEIKNRLSEEEKKYVLFLGQKKDVYRYYSMADVFVFPSLHESFGLVLLEAQINGLECIASERISRSSLAIEELVEYLPLEEDKWIDAIESKSKRKEYKLDMNKINKFDTSYTTKQAYEYWLKVSNSK